jgi:hypothetical protein
MVGGSWEYNCIRGNKTNYVWCMIYEKLLALERTFPRLLKTFRQLNSSLKHNEGRRREGSEEFFGIYRFIAHEHSVAELIFHIIEGGFEW